MTLEANNPAIEDDDLNTTAPNPAEDLNTTAPNPAEEVWKMPEPVFRRTSGKLPEGFAKPAEAAGESESPMGFESTEPSLPAVEAYGAPIEPSVEPKSSVLKLILVLLGIAGMIAFLIVFLTVVYFFFLR